MEKEASLGMGCEVSKARAIPRRAHPHSCPCLMHVDQIQGLSYGFRANGTAQGLPRYSEVPPDREKDTRPKLPTGLRGLDQVCTSGTAPLPLRGSS